MERIGLLNQRALVLFSDLTIHPCYELYFNMWVFQYVAFVPSSYSGGWGYRPDLAGIPIPANFQDGSGGQTTIGLAQICCLGVIERT